MKFLAYAGLIFLLLSMGVATSRVYHVINPGAAPYKRAKELVAQERYREAIPDLKNAEAYDFKRHHVIELLARSYMKLELFTDALPYMEEVVKRIPEVGNVRALAGLYDQRGEVKRAIELYDRYPSSDVEVELHLANLLMREKNYARSEELYRSILQKGNGNAEARVRFAEMLSWQGRYDEALSMLENMPRGTWSRHAAIVKARTLSWSGRFADAASVYKGLLAEAQ